LSENIQQHMEKTLEEMKERSASEVDDVNRAPTAEPYCLMQQQQALQREQQYRAKQKQQQERLV
jgi:hypothetical protein